MYLRAGMLLAVFFAGLNGCSDGDGGPGAGATDAEVRGLCSSQCDRQARCESNPSQTKDECTGSCLEDIAPVGGNYRGDFIRAFASCNSKSTCEENDDDCLEQVVESLGYDIDSLDNEPDSKACLQKREACRTSDGSSFTDDYCFQFVLLTTSKRAEAGECTEKACDEVIPCLKGIFGD